MLSIKEFIKDWVTIILLMVKDLATRYDPDQIGFYFCYPVIPILTFVMLIITPLVYLVVLIDDLRIHGLGFPDLINKILEYRFVTPKDNNDN